MAEHVTKQANLPLLSTAELTRQLAEAAQRRAPGVLFAATSAEGQPLVRCAGRADLATGRVLTVDTPMPWFSATKLFTAVAVMQLVEAGELVLDAPLGRYLTAPYLSRDGREATVAELLSHTAGLGNPIPVRWIHLASEPREPLRTLVARHVGDAPRLSALPGQRFAYSNLGYLVLGLVIERVAATSYEQYVVERVLKPLGCTRTSFTLPGDAATGHQKRLSAMGLASRWLLDGRFFAEPREGYWPLCPFAVDGAPYGGLVGPVDELLALGRAVLRQGEGERGRLLSPASVATMLEARVGPGGKRFPVGLGFLHGREGEVPFVHHIGGGGGFRAELRIYPQLDYAAAVIGSETSFPTGDYLGARITDSPSEVNQRESQLHSP